MHCCFAMGGTERGSHALHLLDRVGNIRFDRFHRQPRRETCHSHLKAAAGALLFLLRSTTILALILIQQLWILLHHAFQSRRLLKRCLGRIGIFRIDKLRDSAFIFLHHQRIRIVVDHKRVGVTGILRVAGTGVVDITIWQQRRQLIVFHIDGQHIVGVLFVGEFRDRTNGLSSSTRYCHRVHRILFLHRHSQGGWQRAKRHRIRVLKKK
mmetsp:Transcript_25792/g.42128  ORF Transcript_25792/g.42128 Transcript_25792/m.42128 type:complete len:210 (-) Transcript_25792:802-1431(-)